MPYKMKSILLIVLCALCWGPAFLFIKLAVDEIPPLTMVCLRVMVALVIMYAACFITKQTDFDWKNRWKNYAVLGFTLNALPWFLLAFSELYIPTSLAGILSSLALIFTAIISHYFGAHDPFTKNKLFGIALGIFGFGMIYLPMVFHERIENSLGVVLMILSGLCVGVGTVYVRTHLQKNIPANTLLAGQLTFALLFLIPLSLFIDRPFTLPFPSAEAIFGVLWVGVIGTAMGFFLFYQAIKIAGPTYAALSLLLVPIPAMFMGSHFLHEALTWNLYVGTFFILTGVLAVNPIFDKKL